VRGCVRVFAYAGAYTCMDEESKTPKEGEGGRERACVSERGGGGERGGVQKKRGVPGK